MASPSSPVKKRAATKAASTRNASAAPSAEDSVSAAARLGLQVPGGVGMLPTPSKTPTNRQTKKDETELKAISRNIFMTKEEDQILPSPKKRRAKKYNGLSLESFRAEEVEDEITIFTDSQERLPEIDDSASNPFHGAGTHVGATTRSRSQRAMIDIPGEGPQFLEDALLRNDGMVYVFRGKKKFRKFRDDDSSEGPAHSVGEVSPSRPQTRSVQPRLLFPTRTTSDIDEEEAPTDIEDAAEEADATAGGEDLTTPADMVAHEPITPKAPKFAPASPPTTGRATRTVNKHVAAVANTRVTAKGSPFDGWRRKKAPSTQGQKRQADSLESDNTKRVRSSL